MMVKEGPKKRIKDIPGRGGINLVGYMVRTVREASSGTQNRNLNVNECIQRNSRQLSRSLRLD